MNVLKGLLRGAAAGAAGTTALNTATYTDMVLRARPASSSPEDTVEELSQRTGVEVPGDDDEQSNRVAGLGPLTGIAAGVGSGAAIGALRAIGFRPPVAVSAMMAAALAMVAGNAPMTALGVTDPRDWSTTSWAADAVPHVAYGLITAAVLSGFERP